MPAKAKQEVCCRGHDWSSWGPSTLSTPRHLMRHRSCSRCGSTQDTAAAELDKPRRTA